VDVLLVRDVLADDDGELRVLQEREQQRRVVAGYFPQAEVVLRDLRGAKEWRRGVIDARDGRDIGPAPSAAVPSGSVNAPAH